jgi:predicted ATPase
MSPGTPPRNSTRVSTPNRNAKRKAQANANKARARSNARKLVSTYKTKFFKLKKKRNTATVSNFTRYQAMMNQLGANYTRAAQSLGYIVESRILRGRTSRPTQSGSQN